MIEPTDCLGGDYRRLPSLEEYVLVAQDVRRVEVYRRETGWDLEVYREKGNFNLRCLGLELSVADVYEGALAAPRESFAER